MATERFEVHRQVAAPPEKVFALLSDPQGHVSIDSSGMLQTAEGDVVAGVGDEFVVHMDRESLNDYPMGKYDVTVIITRFERDAEIGTRVTSYYDWSEIDETYRDKGIFPVIPEAALRATLGILARTVERG